MSGGMNAFTLSAAFDFVPLSLGVKESSILRTFLPSDTTVTWMFADLVAVIALRLLVRDRAAAFVGAGWDTWRHGDSRRAGECVTVESVHRYPPVRRSRSSGFPATLLCGGVLHQRFERVIR